MEQTNTQKTKEEVNGNLNVSLTLESYTARQSQEETSLYLEQEANHNISDCLARDKQLNSFEMKLLKQEFKK